DEYAERDRVDQRAGEQLAAPRLEEPEHEPAEQGAVRVAEPTQYRGDKAEQRVAAGIGRAERGDRPHGGPGGAGERGRDAERERVDVAGTDAHEPGGAAVHPGGQDHDAGAGTPD